MDGDRIERVTSLLENIPLRKQQLERWEAFEKSNPVAPRKPSDRHVRFGLGTQLFSAASQGEAEDVKELLALGADPSAANADGLAPCTKCALTTAETWPSCCCRREPR